MDLTLLSILTIVGSGVMSAVVTYKLNLRKSERDFRRQKLQELYLALHRFNIALGANNVVWIPVMAGEMDFNKALDLIIKNADRHKGHWEELCMLVDLFFPEMRKSLKRTLEIRDALNHIQGGFKMAYEAGLETTSFLEPFRRTILLLDTSEAEFKNELSALARKLD
jgi:hypothetical protein